MARLKMEVRQALELLGQKGPTSKLHNLILWIQKAPQRIQKFKDLTTEEPDARDKLMVIRDNSTRWNSSYCSISRALLLKNRLQLLTQIYTEDLDEDILSDEDWQTLQPLERILKPFQAVTKRLEGNETDGQYGSVWEALPAMELLIKHLDEMKQIYTQANHPELATGINFAWSNTTLKLDDSPAFYAAFPAFYAALMLYPHYRLRDFDESWKGSLARYLTPMKKTLRALHDSEYKIIPVEQQEEIEKDIFDTYG